jgi:hypothetical protein
MGIWYCTREDVKSALDFKETARNNEQIDRAIEAGSRSVEKLTHRVFYPEIDTRYFDWPTASSWDLWLDDNELISLTSLTSGGTVVPPASVFLEPNAYGPPFNRVSIDKSTSSSFSSGSTSQRAIAVVGLYGYSDDSAPAGSSAGSLTASQTTLVVTDSTAIGVGSIVRVEDERFKVTAKNMTSTSQTLQTPLAAQQNAITVAVSTGSAYVVGEVLLLDSEKMRIVEIAGNNLTVQRAWDGSVLATHTGSTIYAPRLLTIVRGVLGTTATTHNTALPLTKYVPPGPVQALAIAEAISQIQQETSGYGRVVGSGDNAREARGAGLGSMRQTVYDGFARKGRMRWI